MIFPLYLRGGEVHPYHPGWEPHASYARFSLIHNRGPHMTILVMVYDPGIGWEETRDRLP
jgi:hypothetical protein